MAKTKSKKLIEGHHAASAPIERARASPPPQPQRERCTLTGLQDKSLNGTSATILNWDAHKLRYNVRIDADNSIKAVAKRNVVRGSLAAGSADKNTKEVANKKVQSSSELSKVDSIETLQTNPDSIEEIKSRETSKASNSVSLTRPISVRGAGSIRDRVPIIPARSPVSSDGGKKPSSVFSKSYDPKKRDRTTPRGYDPKNKKSITPRNTRVEV